MNKANLIKRCCGKCQLSKKIATEDNKDKQNPDRKNENKSELFSPAFFLSPDKLYCKTLIKAYPPFHLYKCIGCSFDIFHPPSI